MSEVGSVSIPDEALEAVEKATYMWDDVPIEAIREAVLNAAAPYIDLAARIDELKRLAAESANWYDAGTEFDLALYARIAELEAQQ